MIAQTHPVVLRANDALRTALDSQEVQDMVLFAKNHGMALRIVLKLSPRNEVDYGFSLDSPKGG